MTSSKRTCAMTQAAQAHRDALQATREAVAEWASKYEGRRDRIAGGMLELLSGCERDKNGSRTLQVVSDVFDDHAELLTANQANGLAHALGHLGQAAQALGHRRSMRVES
jgi:hypothetical protein